MVQRRWLEVKQIQGLGIGRVGIGTMMDLRFRSGFQEYDVGQTHGPHGFVNPGPSI